MNFTSAPARVSLAGAWIVEVASEGVGEGARFSGDVGADQALVLRPPASP